MAGNAVPSRTFSDGPKTDFSTTLKTLSTSSTNRPYQARVGFARLSYSKRISVRPTKKARGGAGRPSGGVGPFFALPKCAHLDKHRGLLSGQESVWQLPNRPPTFPRSVR